MRSAVAALVGPLVLVGLVSQARPARAESGRVTLLEPAGTSAGARRCLTRIREELIAGGFEVAIVDPGPRNDPVSTADAMERQRDSVATIALLGDPELGPAELWILDRVGDKAEVRRLPAQAEDPDRIPEVLAIRTIELLRASALKLLVESNRPPTPPPAPVPTRAPSLAASPSRDDRGAGRPSVGLETGISLLGSAGGPGPATIPLARVRIPVGGPFWARLTLAGLGSRPRVQTTLGSAAVSQTLGLGELTILFRSGRRLRPLVSFGGGALYVQSDGEAVSPYRGNRSERWAAVADGGVGVLGAFGRELALALEVHAFVAFPYPVVRFVDVTAATIGRPAVMASLTLVAWL